MRLFCLMLFAFCCHTLTGQVFAPQNWTYVPIDSSKQKWGDWAQPEWLRYFGLDAGDVDRDGLLDVISGRYIYHNPGGAMSGNWQRTVLDDNVDGIFYTDVDDDAFADIIAMALPNIYWYEALDESGKSYRRTLISSVPATSHVNSQGFEKADVIAGGKTELLIAGNGNVYAISIPEQSKTGELWPTQLIAANTSDEGIGFGDIDGDGDIDLACGRRPEGEGEPTILVWFENPGHTDTPWSSYVVGHTEHPIDRIEIADLNGDGQADIVMAEERYPGLEPDGSLFWFSAQSNRKKEWAKQLIVTQYSSNNLDVADIDKDGDIDLLTGEHKGQVLELQIWENDGQGQFAKHVIDTGKENHLGTQWVDLDADGDLDIIGAAWDNYKWQHVWINNQVKPVKSGSIFREYHWYRSLEDKEEFLRVGGKYDYKTYDKFFPTTRHKAGQILLAEELDLDKATHAELVVERLQSHEDTRDLQIRINGQAWLPIPEPALIPDTATNYMFHYSPRINLPLQYIAKGEAHFELKVDSSQAWNWPQNIIYGITLRIYYESDKLDRRASITGLEAGVNLEAQQPLSLSHPKVDKIKHVDYLGLYQDVNWQGDGIYQQWQFHSHRTQIRNHIGSSSTSPFKVIWNTEWVPDQAQKIKIMARVTTDDGLIYYTPEVVGLTLDRDYAVHLIKPYDQPAFWVTRSGTFAQQFYMPSWLDELQAAKLFWRSWSPCYSEGFELNGQALAIEEDWPCYAYFEHSQPLQDLSLLKSGQNKLETLKTPLHDGKMVHGMEIQWPGIMLKVKAKQQAKRLSIQEVSYQGAPHYLVQTEKVSYYYDREGGGFSRIIDREGNDWVSFKKEPWGEYPASAASAFRGLPNLVWQGADDGAGHPGHKKCNSWLDGNQIVTESKSGKWKWRWSFGPDYAQLEVIKTNLNRGYWFLYEGTPGGKYQPDQTYFGTNISAPSDEQYDYFKNKLLKQNMRWAYCGIDGLDRVFYMVQVEADQEDDIISMLGNSEKGIASADGMTVWGFGRNEKPAALLDAPQQFVIGFYPKEIDSVEKHQAFAQYIEQTILKTNLKKK